MWECAFHPRGKYRTRSQCRLQSCTLTSTTPQVLQGRIEVCYGLLIPLDTRSLEGFQIVLASAFNMDAVGMPNCCRATNVFGGVAQHLLWISSQTPPRKKQMPAVRTKWSDRCMQSIQQLFTVNPCKSCVLWSQEYKRNLPPKTNGHSTICAWRSFKAPSKGKCSTSPCSLLSLQLVVSCYKLFRFLLLHSPVLMHRT